MVDSWSLTQLSFDEGDSYSVGFNDGREFIKMVYTGTKLLNGKTMLCFKTEDQLDAAVNPSYVSFYVKEHNTNKKE